VHEPPFSSSRWNIPRRWDCVLALTPADFYKTMESEAAPGLWQDVYRPVFSGLAMYLKLQISFDGFVVVISFKEL
jgi:motility quorum-sensing regulator/GCU-specific mRNA interferase toxin